MWEGEEGGRRVEWKAGRGETGTGQRDKGERVMGVDRWEWTNRAVQALVWIVQCVLVV